MTMKQSPLCAKQGVGMSHESKHGAGDVWMRAPNRQPPILEAISFSQTVYASRIKERKT